MPRLDESRLTGFSFKQYQFSYRPLRPKKTRASHNLSPAWDANRAKREGGQVLNVGHMEMTNSSTLEESCLATSVAGSARLSTLLVASSCFRCSFGRHLDTPSD